MYDYKAPWKKRIAEAINAIMKEAGIDGSIDPEQIIAENPPNPEMGDIGFPMFGFSKTLRKGPPQIALLAAQKIAEESDSESLPGSVQAQGPYYMAAVTTQFKAAALPQNPPKNIIDAV